jgi:hypothetical protein
MGHSDTTFKIIFRSISGFKITKALEGINMEKEKQSD